MKPKPDFLAILQTLVAHCVDFLVVGGVCAVLHGAPIATFDLDLVHSRHPDNIQRLSALEALEAHYRTLKDLKPDASHLSSAGHQLLLTCFGLLDILGEIGNGRGYGELLRDSVEMNVEPETAIRLLSLEALIRIKEETARDKNNVVWLSFGAPWKKDQSESDLPMWSRSHYGVLESVSAKQPAQSESIGAVGFPHDDGG